MLAVALSRGLLFYILVHLYTMVLIIYLTIKHIHVLRQYRYDSYKYLLICDDAEMPIPRHGSTQPQCSSFYDRSIVASICIYAFHSYSIQIYGRLATRSLVGPGGVG